MSKSNDYRDNLHKDAKRSTYKNARELRHTETKAEKKLWQLLRNRQLDRRKFRRQHALDQYVVDFYCHECKLAIEVDGGIHHLEMNKQYDEVRTGRLNELGITVLRFSNEEVFDKIDNVLKIIQRHF